VAYLISFRLLARWDATRASMVTYLLPIVGVTLGALVLGEQVDARIVVGVALIVGGVAAVNLGRAGAPSASGGLPAEA
jgi:drug/metabolite transporter (DMT)-like permease